MRRCAGRVSSPSRRRQRSSGAILHRGANSLLKRPLNSRERMQIACPIPDPSQSAAADGPFPQQKTTERTQCEPLTLLSAATIEKTAAGTNPNRIGRDESIAALAPRRWPTREKMTERTQIERLTPVFSTNMPMAPLGPKPFRSAAFSNRSQCQSGAQLPRGMVRDDNHPLTAIPLKTQDDREIPRLPSAVAVLMCTRVRKARTVVSQIPAPLDLPNGLPVLAARRSAGYPNRSLKTSYLPTGRDILGHKKVMWKLALFVAFLMRAPLLNRYRAKDRAYTSSWCWSCQIRLLPVQNRQRLDYVVSQLLHEVSYSCHVRLSYNYNIL